MYIPLICLMVITSAIACNGELVESSVTLHHGIQSSADDRIDHKHGPQSPVDPPSHTAGYLPLNHTHDTKLFYYYAQERSKSSNAPLVWWFNGGPGSSSMMGAFGGQGPFDVGANLELKWNTFGWDQGHNMLFVDQPVGTGFSETTDERDYVHWGEQIGKDGLVFLLDFMELHPELQGKELFLAGISYAGHYIPAIAHAILNSNKQGKSMHLNLKGVLLGNPSINALYEYVYSPLYALENNLLSNKAVMKAVMYIDECKEWSATCNREKAQHACGKGLIYCIKHLYDPVKSAHPNINVYDIRKIRANSNGADDVGAGSITKYLNLPTVQLQLGVNTTWESGSDKVKRGMIGDMFIDMTPHVVDLLNDGIRVIVYSGDQDYRCNWMGNKELLNDMQWNKSKQWKDILKPWIYEYEGEYYELGECEVAEPLTHCRIYDQGHKLVPYIDQEIARRFIAGEGFVAPDPPKRARKGRKELITAI